MIQFIDAYDSRLEPSVSHFFQLESYEYASVKLEPKYDNVILNKLMSSAILFRPQCVTVKPVYNDHLYNKLNYLWFI